MRHFLLYLVILITLHFTVSASAEPLKQIVYVSHSINPTLTHEELQDIVLSCRRRNSESDITGLLLYKEGNVCQILEGLETVINDTMERIRDDARHGGIIIVLNRFVEKRSFRHWNIAFRNLAYTADMNSWADDQAVLTDSEEQLLFDRIVRFANLPRRKVDKSIARLINLYQRILLRIEPHETLENQWERVNRVGSSTSLQQEE